MTTKNESIAETVTFLVSRARGIILFSLLCTIAATAVTLLMDNTYDARVMFLVSEPKLELSNRYIEPVKIRNYAELITAETVVNDAWRELDGALKKPPRPFNRRTLGERLDVVIHRDSQLIELIVRAGNPDDAALIANTIGRRFVNHIDRITERASRSIEDLISEQVRETTERLQHIDDELKKFHNETGIIHLDTEQDLSLKRLDVMSLNISQKISEKEGLSASVALLETFLTRQQPLLTLKTYLERKPVLANRINQTEQKSHAKTGSEKEEDQSPIALEETVVNISYQNVWEKLATQKSKHAALEVEIESLRKDITALQKKIDSFPENALRYRKLNGESELYKEVLKALLKQFDEAKVLVASKSGIVEIVNGALPPLKPSSPKRLMLIIFSFLCSVWLAVSALLLSRALGFMNSAEPPFPS